MSYEKVRSVNIDEKEGKVFLTSACNNVRPLDYHRWDIERISEILRKEGREKAEIELLRLYDEGELQGGSNKFTRALKALRYGLRGEYAKFDWVHNWEESRETRQMEDYDKLLAKALKYKIPKTKYIICKPYVGDTTIYGKVLKHSIQWSSNKEEATKHDFKEEAERVMSWFVNNNFFIESYEEEKCDSCGELTEVTRQGLCESCYEDNYPAIVDKSHEMMVPCASV